MSKTKTKPKKHVVRHRQKAKVKEDDSKNYYRMYKKEKRERERLQNINGQIDNRIEKTNKENEEIFKQMKIAVDYWRFSFILSESHGVDFLNYEIGLIEKGLMQTEQNISKLNIPNMEEDKK